MRDRITEFKRVPASQIDGFPGNWRKHGEAQRAAVAASLNELGIIDALRVRVTADGRYELWDGHLREDLFMGCGPDTLVPILVTDLDEAEAKKANLVFDPLASMAEADAGKLDALLREVQTGDEALAGMLSGLAEENGIVNGDEPALKPINVLPPPKMTWVLVGIPTVRFGEINADVERLAKVQGIILESTSNDG